MRMAFLEAASGAGCGNMHGLVGVAIVHGFPVTLLRPFWMCWHAPARNRCSIRLTASGVRKPYDSTRRRDSMRAFANALPVSASLAQRR